MLQIQHLNNMEHLDNQSLQKSNMDELLKKHNELIAKAVVKEQEQTQESVVLPYWSENIRGIANSVLRSSLFGIIKKGDRVSYTRELLAAQSGIEIRYTGVQLDQLDLAVWESLIHIARMHPLGSNVHFHVSYILDILEKSKGKANYEWFKECLSRLKATAIEIKYSNKTYAGSLVQNFYRNDDTNDYVIVLDPKLSYLYAQNEWTKLRAEDRLLLSGKPLALWLHGYYSSHIEPFPLKIETIHRLSGSNAKQIKTFSQKLKSALTEVSEVTGWIFEVKQGMVYVNKKAS